MYKQRPVYPQNPDVNDKTYLRRLVGRINRLKKMIGVRKSTKISEIKTEIDEIDEKIFNLQKEKEKWVSKMDLHHQEISEIQSEIKDYSEKVKKVMSDKTKPLFQVYKRKKKSKIGGKDYEYFEGRVRSKMRKGLLMKDKYYHIGDYNESRRKVREEYGIQLPSDTKEFELKEHLKKWVEDMWLRDLDSISLD